MSSEKYYDRATGPEKKDMVKNWLGIPDFKFAKKLYKDMKKDLADRKIKFKVKIVNHLARVPTMKADNRTQEEILYWVFLQVGFEGSMVRNTDGNYRADDKKKRIFKKPGFIKTQA